VPSYATHLAAALDGTRYELDRPQSLHAGRPLVAEYDLARLAREVPRAAVLARAPGLWRWRELLPHQDDGARVSLGEGETALVACPAIARRHGLAELLVKDESTLPTGSFKSRGMAVAVSRARELGLARLAIPTAGNAGGALAAYAARAGLACTVFMPADTPLANQVEALHYGAQAYLVDGLIHDCGALVAEGAARGAWFDFSTLKEPYRLEGKKTMGLELALQLGWRLPDVILYPTGGGTGLIGMWKAFRELAALGWLADERLPRLVAVQSDGCAPIARAFERGQRFAEPFEHAATSASGIRVPKAVGDFMILDAVRASGGAAVAVAEAAILPAAREAASLSGVAICPETGACFAALPQLAERGLVRRDERAVVFNTGAAHKYVEALSGPLAAVRRLARGELPELPPLPPLPPLPTAG
jgi:threonine synthase